MPSELWTDTTIFEWPGSSALFAEHCPSDRAAHLGDSVEADEVEIIICATEIRPVVGDGSWRYAVVHRVTGGVEELLAAYAQPDDDTEVDICTTKYIDPGHVWLHEPDGQVATVRAPTDRCHPLDLATEAFRGLTTVLVAEERLDQPSTQLLMTRVAQMTGSTSSSTQPMITQWTSPPTRGSCTTDTCSRVPTS